MNCIRFARGVDAIRHLHDSYAFADLTFADAARVSVRNLYALPPKKLVSFIFIRRIMHFPPNNLFNAFHKQVCSLSRPYLRVNRELTACRKFCKGAIFTFIGLKHVK
jgi:hypothetical protein